MNIIEHKTLWNLDTLVKEYSISNPALTFAEFFLLEKAIQRLKNQTVKKILCVGCGGGREVLPLHKSFSSAVIYANDIAANMISAAENNFEEWGIAANTELMLSPVNEIPIAVPTFQLITCFNNVFSCVSPFELCTASFKKLSQVIDDKGVLIGMVHNMYGTPQKTLFFILQKLFSFFRKDEWGDRIAGRENQKYKAHYFNKRQLGKYLTIAGFKSIEVLSLQELYTLKKRKYNRLKGSNNLVFIATK